jgi:hypothetical protein
MTISLFFLLRVSRSSRIIEALFLSLVLLSIVLARLVLIVILGRNLIVLIKLLRQALLFRRVVSLVFLLLVVKFHT